MTLSLLKLLQNVNFVSNANKNFYYNKNKDKTDKFHVIIVNRRYVINVLKNTMAIMK